MQNKTEFKGAMAWCKKYNLCFTSEYHYMEKAINRMEEEKRMKQFKNEKEVIETVEEINTNLILI